MTMNTKLAKTAQVFITSMRKQKIKRKLAVSF